MVTARATLARKKQTALFISAGFPCSESVDFKTFSGSASFGLLPSQVVSVAVTCTCT